MLSRRPFISFAALTLSVLVLAGCGSGDDDSTSAPTAQPSKPASSSGGSDAVTISDFKFSPATLTVKPGAKVTVTNNDSTTHTATADSGGFDTGDLNPGSSKTITLSKAGSYPYHCEIHPFMKATIVVK